MARAVGKRLAPVWRWVAVHVFRRRRSAIVKATTAHIKLSVSDTVAIGSVRPAPLSDGATVDERLAWLERFVGIVASETERLRNDGRAQLDAVERRLGERLDTLDTGLATLGQDVGTVREAMFGLDGAGLRKNGRWADDHRRRDPGEYPRLVELIVRRSAAVRRRRRYTAATIARRG